MVNRLIVFIYLLDWNCMDEQRKMDTMVHQIEDAFVIYYSLKPQDSK